MQSAPHRSSNKALRLTWVDLLVVAAVAASACTTATRKRRFLTVRANGTGVR